MAKIWLIKLMKAYGGRTASQLWSNTYHVSTEAIITNAGWQPLVEAMASREVLLHNPQVNFMRATISSFTQEPEYDPMSLRVFELQGVGQRSVPAGQIALPLDLALKCKKNVAYGRSGTMFYRGILHSGDVTVGAGGNATLNSPGDGNLTANIAGIVTQLQDELLALGAELIMPPSTLPTQQAVVDVRIISSFTASGVSVNKRNHRYFDTARSDDGVGVGT